MLQGLEKQITLLMELGLTRLQARIYLSLLKESGRTGYGVAKEIDEPVANTYKALESLRQDGLVLMKVEARIKTFSAQPIKLYLDQRERQFFRQRGILEESLKSIVPASPGEGFFAIESCEQLYALSSTLIGKGRDPIGVEGTPFPIDQLKADLQKAARAGRTVLVKSYEEVDIPGCTVVFSKEMRSPVLDLPMELLHVAVPGEGYVIGITGRENRRLLHGVYVRNLFLSIMAYNGFTMEFLVTKAFEMLHGNRSGKDVLREWKKLEGLAPSRTSAWRAFRRSLDLFKNGEEV
jgi:sugar-specific transcriptional regulator TrmB